jgi:ATP adenylyltransferase
MDFRQGTLWQSILTATDRALRTGALLPITTEYTFIEDRGARFFVRVLASIRRKDEERKKQDAREAEGKKANPFLTPEKDLFVADVSDTHLAILNKFNVVDHHLLIVTRRFEDQETLLTVNDFEALWLCMAEYRGLGFYNGGREGGASQEHKHLQIVPLPLAPEGPAVPVQPLIDRAVIDRDGFGTIPDFDFRHVFVRLDPDIAEAPGNAARKTFEIYAAMLQSLGMQSPPHLRQSMPYCFLVTREWMLLVPRSREHFEDISFNSLAFAGSFFVRSAEQLERLRSFGPLNALRSVAVPE